MARPANRPHIVPVGTANVGADYTDEERELLIAMQRWRTKTGIVWPNVTDWLHVIRWLGYRKVEPQGSPDELIERKRR